MIQPRRLTVAFTLLVALTLPQRVATAQDAARVLTLGEALAQLEETNLDVAAAAQQVEVAEMQLRQARTVIYPTLALDAVYTLNDDEVSFGGGNPYTPIEPYITAVYDEFGEARGLDDPAELLAFEPAGGIAQNRHDVRGSLTIEQTLFNARSRAGVRLIDARVGVAEAGVEQARYLLTEPLIEAYYGAVLAQRVVDIRERERALAALALERAEVALVSEVGNRFEVTRAEVSVTLADRALDNARLAYALAREGVASLLVVPMDFEVEAPPARSVPSDVSDDRAFAPDRPDLRVIDAQLTAQGFQLNQIRGQWFPVIIGQFQLSGARQTAFSGDPFRWSLTVAANWMLFDAGYRRYARRVEEERTFALELERRRGEAQISSGLRTLAIQIAQEQENVSASGAQVALAEESLALAESALALGVASTLDVQVAREQLAQAELAQATSEISLQALLARLEWARAQGGTGAEASAP